MAQIDLFCSFLDLFIRGNVIHKLRHNTSNIGSCITNDLIQNWLCNHTNRWWNIWQNRHWSVTHNSGDVYWQMFGARPSGRVTKKKVSDNQIVGVKTTVSDHGLFQRVWVGGCSNGRCENFSFLGLLNTLLVWILKWLTDRLRWQLIVIRLLFLSPWANFSPSSSMPLAALTPFRSTPSHHNSRLQDKQLIDKKWGRNMARIALYRGKYYYSQLPHNPYPLSGHPRLWVMREHGVWGMF